MSRFPSRVDQPFPMSACAELVEAGLAAYRRSRGCEPGTPPPSAAPPPIIRRSGGRVPVHSLWQFFRHNGCGPFAARRDERAM